MPTRAPGAAWEGGRLVRDEAHQLRTHLLFTITDEILSSRFCGGVDFLKLINKYTVSNMLTGTAMKRISSGNTGQLYLKQCMYLLVLESPLPLTAVDLTF